MVVGQVGNLWGPAIHRRDSIVCGIRCFMDKLFIVSLENYSISYSNLVCIWSPTILNLSSKKVFRLMYWRNLIYFIMIHMRVAMFFVEKYKTLLILCFFHLQHV